MRIFCPYALHERTVSLDGPDRGIVQQMSVSGIITLPGLTGPDLIVINGKKSESDHLIADFFKHFAPAFGAGTLDRKFSRGILVERNGTVGIFDGIFFAVFLVPFAAFAVRTVIHRPEERVDVNLGYDPFALECFEYFKSPGLGMEE